MQNMIIFAYIRTHNTNAVDQILHEAGLVTNISTAQLSDAALLEQALQSALPEYTAFDPIKEV